MQYMALGKPWKCCIFIFVSSILKLFTLGLHTLELYYLSEIIIRKIGVKVRMGESVITLREVGIFAVSHLENKTHTRTLKRRKFSKSILSSLGLISCKKV